MTAFVSGTGPSEIVPSVATMLDCWRRTPPPKIHTSAALASLTTACAESRRIFVTLIRKFGDFDLAEEALHDAFRAALEQWSRDEMPTILIRRVL